MSKNHQDIEVIKHSGQKAKFSIDLKDMISNSDQTLLRILHYPPMTGDEEPGAIRAAAHGDINLLTVLPAANEPGLGGEPGRGGLEEGGGSLQPSQSGSQVLAFDYCFLLFDFCFSLITIIIITTIIIVIMLMQYYDCHYRHYH